MGPLGVGEVTMTGVLRLRSGLAHVEPTSLVIYHVRLAPSLGHKGPTTGRPVQIASCRPLTDAEPSA